MINSSYIVFSDIRDKKVTVQRAKLGPNSLLSSRFHRHLSSQSLWPSVRTEGTMGREDGEIKSGLLTVLSHFLFVFETAEHPLLLARLQPSRLKINVIHSFLVSLSPTAPLGDRLLRWGPAKLCSLVPVCSLHVPEHWESMG